MLASASLELMNRTFVCDGEPDCVNSVGATMNEKDEWHWPMFVQNGRNYLLVILCYK